MKKEKSVYPTTQELLYTICLNGWALCLQFIAEFAAYKASYTAAFVKSSVTAVNDARELPKLVATINERKAARINLNTGNRLVMKNWRLLKMYIENAYPAEMIATMLDRAGAAYYRKVANDNWSSVRKLIDAANDFIEAEAVTLSANNNMPDTFQASFAADGKDVNALYIIFVDADIAKESAVNTKLSANNAIYNSLLRMLRDGQQIITDDAADSRRLFTFAHLKALNSGDKPASLSGYMKNELNLPVKGAVITSKDGLYTATTNSKGRYVIGRIAAGIYTFNITCPGYVPMEKVINFEAATAKRAGFILTNGMMKKTA